MTTGFTGRVLVTGGSGYLARAIYEDARMGGWTERGEVQFTCYSRDERKQELLKAMYPEVHCVIGDLRDRDRLALIMRGHDTVIHAGALKYVPEAEYHPGEAIAVNVDGSRNVIAAARDAGVDTVIGISTDKAVRPVNVYGWTKVLMERLFLEAAAYDRNRKYVVARYGNVIGSTGSIIPKFRHALLQRQTVQLTSEQMTRFWMSPRDAVHAIKCAATQESGTIIARLCPGLSMTALIEYLAPAVGAPVPLYKVIGVRPGEKLNEALVAKGERGVTVEWGNHTYYLIQPGKPEATADYTSDNPVYRLSQDALNEALVQADKLEANQP